MTFDHPMLVCDAPLVRHDATMTRESIATSTFFGASPRDHIDAEEVFAATNLKVGADRHVLTGQVGSHDHDFVEIVVVLGGTALHRTVHGDRPLRSGMGIVLPAGSWHAYLDCDRLDVFDCYVANEMLWRQLLWTRDDPVFSRLLWSPRSLNREGGISFNLGPESLGRSLGELNAIRRLAALQPMADQTAALTGHLSLLLQEMRDSVALEGTEDLDAMPIAVRTCIDLFEREASRNWTLNDLAAATDLNGSYLSRLFRRWTGLPPKAYLARWRLERAAEMLLHTDKPIAIIACDVGWFDSALFARRFRAHFGVSATQYRERSRTQHGD